MKLIANSFWGFLAKRPNKRQHKFITKTPDWLTMLADASNIIEDVDFKHKDVLQVYYTKNEEMELPAPNTNVVLASFVTAQGRLKLYSELQKLNDRILYIDTIIFVSKPDMNLRWDQIFVSGQMKLVQKTAVTLKHSFQRDLKTMAMICRTVKPNAS